MSESDHFSWSGNPEVWTIGETGAEGAEWISVFDPMRGYETKSREALVSPIGVPDLARQGAGLTLLVFAADQAEFAEASTALTAHATGVEDEVPLLDVQIRGFRVLMKGAVALLAAPPQSVRSVTTAVLRFWELRKTLDKLGTDLAQLVNMARAAAPLTHAVGAIDLKQQENVNRATHDAVELRGVLTIAENLIEYPRAIKGALAKRLFLELAQQSGIAAELSAHDNAVEFVQDTFEIANDRLTEYRYFRSEMIMEITIAVLIFAELVFLIIDYFH